VDRKNKFWQRIYKKNPNMVARKIEDEIILVPIKRKADELEAIYNLNNEVSVRIWELINGRRTLGQIRDNILSEFEVSQERLERDLKEFIEDLSKIEAIR
jgi:hypothetical protein